MTRTQTRLPEQRWAADPSGSIWVTANAGSGKTSVLVDRILRLLLAGVLPARLLCLTYTRAAAAEMRARLLKVLGAWTAMPHEALAQALGDLMDRNPDDAQLAGARTLFARVLETPGGLKFQTIHAFCEALLSRFPLEAQIPIAFEVLDEAGAQALMSEAKEDMFAKAADAPDGRLARAIAELGTRAGDANFDEALKAVLGKRTSWSGSDNQAGTDALIARLDAMLGLRPGETEADVFAQAYGLLEPFEVPRVARALCQGGKNNQKIGQPLADALAARDPAALFAALYKVFRDSNDEWRDITKLLDKAALKSDPGCVDVIKNLEPAFKTIEARANAAFVAAATRPLLVLGAEIHARYRAMKRARAALDYDDLIVETEALLKERATAQWVLFKLDDGIDHVLLDEAQDTAPPQWSILAELTDEFFSGLGRDPRPRAHRPRTVFAVGDSKQSIFSFQGADPKGFATMRETWGARARGAGAPFDEVALRTSFRSAEPVLTFVDAVFAQGPAREGVAGGGPDGDVRHIAMRKGPGGLVEIWDLETETNQAKDEIAWDQPRDYVSESAALSVLASRIAKQIRGWLDTGEIVESTGKPIEPGDILILLRKRGALAEALIRQLKDQAIPVAGADRLKLNDHIAVEDLVAWGHAALNPRDDFNLACVLKGPLIGLSEEALFHLAYDRGHASLWARLEAKAAQPEYAGAHQALARILNRAGFMAPYEFYAEELGRYGGRHKIHARLGPDAMDPLDEFLNKALAYQRHASPSLQGFLHWLGETAVEIKRDMDASGGVVRVMTVHGAKGLEANIVILPDTCSAPKAKSEEKNIFEWQGLPLASIQKDRDDPVRSQARDAASKREREEYHRLLYVALTRARDRLYICGHAKSGTPAAGSWYQLIEAALPHLAMQEVFDAEGRRLRRLAAKGQAHPAPAILKAEVKPAPRPTSLPLWARAALPLEEAPRRARASATAVAGSRAAVQFGVLAHALFRWAVLNKETPGETQILARARALGGNAADASTAAREIAATLADPWLNGLKGRTIRAEVGFDLRLAPEGTRLAGAFDYVIADAGRLCVLELKSDRRPPHSPAGLSQDHRRQMGLYARAARQIFEGQDIELRMVWLASQSVMALPSQLLEDWAASLDP